MMVSSCAGVLLAEAMRAEGVKGPLETKDVMPSMLLNSGDDTRLKSDGEMFSGRFSEK